MGHLAAVQQPGYLGGVEHQDQLVRRAGLHPHGRQRRLSAAT
jgi:hypothetical protein